VNVPVKDVQCDEIGVEEAENDSLGDAYCFVAVERHTKLILTFTLGRRNQETANIFAETLRHTTKHSN
jgi:hypothetical protein